MTSHDVAYADSFSSYPTIITFVRSFLDKESFPCTKLHHQLNILNFRLHSFSTFSETMVANHAFHGSMFQVRSLTLLSYS